MARVDYTARAGLTKILHIKVADIVLRRATLARRERCPEVALSGMEAWVPSSKATLALASFRSSAHLPPSSSVPNTSARTVASGERTEEMNVRLASAKKRARLVCPGGHARHLDAPPQQDTVRRTNSLRRPSGGA